MKRIFKKTIPGIPGYHSLCLFFRDRISADTVWIKRVPIASDTIVKVKSRYGDFVMGRPGRCSIAKSLFWSKGIRHPKEDELALDIFSVLAKQSDIILDIGSNSGIFSLVASKANKVAEIIAFDILPEAYHILIDNLMLNSLLNRIKCNLIGVGSPDGIYNAPFNKFSSEMTSGLSLDQNVVNKGRIEVPIKSLDQICIPAFLNKKITIKIDVEGTEIDIFKNSFKTLDQIRPTFICEVLPVGRDIDVYNNILQKSNYSTYLITDKGCLYQENIIAHSKFRDWIFIPKENSVSSLKEFMI